VPPLASGSSAPSTDGPLTGERDGAGQPVRVGRGAVEDLGRRRLEDVERDARQREDRIDPCPVRVWTSRRRPADRRCGGQGGGIRGEREVPVLDRAGRNRGVGRGRAHEDLVLAGRDVATPIRALVEREPAYGQMKVQVLIAEPGEGACTGDRNARRAGERAHRLPALFEVRAGGEGRRSG